MSTDLDAPFDTDLADSGADSVSEDVVTVRRNVLLSGLVGGVALLLGLAYLIRGSSLLDAVLGLVLLAVAALNLLTLASARLPLLVLDEQGVRFRIGATWRGLPWREVRQVVVEHSGSRWRDGRLVIVPSDLATATHSLDPVAAMHLRWNALWFGSAICAPLGITTVIDGGDLDHAVTALAGDRTEVVVLHGHPDATDAPDAPDELVTPPRHRHDDFDEVEFGDSLRAELRGEILERPTDELPPPPEDLLPGYPVEPPPVLLPPAVLPLRDLHAPARVEVRLDELPAWDHAAPVELVLDDEDAGDAETTYPSTTETLLRPEPEPVPSAAGPVIGQKMLHAREMLDMSIEELSQRTRIRPHVLEAIERDDFGPCGGDFYARGHLTAVCRVLGLKLEPLMKVYDEQYAQAPINARRVFEAELSGGLPGGLSSGMRATLGGPRWSLVIGAVLSLTLIWGLARMLAGDPAQLTAAPETNSQTAGLAAQRTPIISPRMHPTAVRITAVYAATRIVVRDRTGKILWSGDLRLGKQRKVVGLAPFRVSADNAGAVLVSIKGKDLGDLGTAGQPGAKRFG